MTTQRPENVKPGQRASDDESEAEVLERVIRLAFGGDVRRYEHFVRTLREAIPPDVSVVLRGSAVTGTRWHHEDVPFDADGPGTSDLDLTLVGGNMVKHFDVFYIPGLHSVPLSEAHPDASATFIPLRSALMNIVGRPVNIQATSDFVQFLRDIVMHQPYFMLSRKLEPTGNGT